MPSISDYHCPRCNQPLPRLLDGADIPIDAPDEPQLSRRERIMYLLGAGHVSQSEAAELLYVSRQRVHQLARAAGINPVGARAELLERLLREARP